MALDALEAQSWSDTHGNDEPANVKARVALLAAIEAQEQDLDILRKAVKASLVANEYMFDCKTPLDSSALGVWCEALDAMPEALRASLVAEEGEGGEDAASE